MAVTLDLKLGGISNQLPLKLIAQGLGEKKGYVTLIPKIDKIALTYDILSDDKDQIASNLKENCGAGGHLTKLPGSRYSVRCKLRDEESGSDILIEMAPKGKKPPPFARLEFNPDHLGSEGLARVKKELALLCTAKFGWPYVLKHARVTMLDIAIDVLGVRPDAFCCEIWRAHGNKTAFKRVLYVGKDGRVETTYPKHGDGQKNAKRYRAYNKLAEIKNTKGGKESPYGETPWQRIELRERPNRSLPELLDLKNPFGPIWVYDASMPVEPPETPHAWAFFIASCQLKGRRATLASIEDQSVRKAYEDALFAADRMVLNEEKVWERWIFAVKSSGLISK